VDRGALAVEERQMGLDTRALGEAATARCCLGSWTLEEDTMGMEVDTRTLEIEEDGPIFSLYII
jgi:hypothetical protein